MTNFLSSPSRQARTFIILIAVTALVALISVWLWSNGKGTQPVTERQSLAPPVPAMKTATKTELPVMERIVVLAPQTSAWSGDSAQRVRSERISAYQYPLTRVVETLTRSGSDQDTQTSREEVIASSSEMVADHFIVTAAPGYEGQLSAAIQAAGCRVRRLLPGGRIALAQFDYAVDVDYLAAREKLLRQSAIALVESDVIGQISATPDDTLYGSQWALEKIDAPTAWNVSTGSRAVVVAVIDTGVDFTHPDLAANLWTSPGETGLDAQGRDKRSNGVDDDNNGYIDDWRGWDFRNGDNDPTDDQYHGTHCAGAIGAVGNNGLGVSGVCWRVSVMPLKHGGEFGDITTSANLEAILYATAMRVRVTSNSYGILGGFSQTMKDAIDAANAAGILMVTSAGNSGQDSSIPEQVQYPAAYECANLLSVAATNRDDTLNPFSNYGLGATGCDLAAPGTGVISTVPIISTRIMPFKPTLVNADGTSKSYGELTGTSMACPLVAGAAALALSRNPNLTVPQLKALLLSSSDRIPGLTSTVPEGRRLNVGRLLATTPAPASIAGDVNVDGIVNATDLALVSAQFGRQGSEVTDARADLDRDGRVTSTDLFIVVNALAP